MMDGDEIEDGRDEEMEGAVRLRCIHPGCTTLAVVCGARWMKPMHLSVAYWCKVHMPPGVHYLGPSPPNAAASGPARRGGR